MHKHHDILLATLSLGLLTAVACDLPAAPVGKDSDYTDSDESEAPQGTDGGQGEGGTTEGIDGGQGGTTEGTDGGMVCEDYNPCAGSENEPGFYSMWMCRPDSAESVLSTHHIPCAPALANCLSNEKSNAPVYCEWDGFEIHRSVDPEGHCEVKHGPATACEDLGRGSCVVSEEPCAGLEGWPATFVWGLACNSEVQTPAIEDATDFSCEDALTACTDYLAAHPDISLACMWSGKVLLRNEVVAGECAAFEPC